MALIGQARIESPLFREALAAAPGMTLELEDIRQKADEPRRFVVWASGGDFDEFEAGLAADPTVGSHHRLADLGEHRLYRLTLSEAGQRKSGYSKVIEEDVVLLDLTFRAGELVALARLPSREALTAVREAYRERGITFRLERLYSEAETGDGGPTDAFGVTDAQREALVRALEAGYYDVPRGTTLDPIAEELGISTTALSTRLRRGQQNLLRHTLASTPPS